MRTHRHTHLEKWDWAHPTVCVCVCVCVHCCTSGAISIAPSRNSSQTLVIESLLHHCTATNINITWRGGAVRCETKFHYQLTDRRPTPYSDMVNPQISVEKRISSSPSESFLSFSTLNFLMKCFPHFKISVSKCVSSCEIAWIGKCLDRSIDRSLLFPQSLDWVYFRYRSHLVECIHTKFPFDDDDDDYYKDYFYRHFTRDDRGTMRGGAMSVAMMMTMQFNRQQKNAAITRSRPTGDETRRVESNQQQTTSEQEWLDFFFPSLLSPLINLFILHTHSLLLLLLLFFFLHLQLDFCTEFICCVVHFFSYPFFFWIPFQSLRWKYDKKRHTTASTRSDHTLPHAITHALTHAARRRRRRTTVHYCCCHFVPCAGDADVGGKTRTYRLRHHTMAVIQTICN